ncbi:MAG: hypothetical protein DSY76_00835 [Bacteroidetes bacterium]|nr:MAG: hypothetical protein DSY76_00835 [Bacteroidota bacterium]
MRKTIQTLFSLALIMLFISCNSNTDKAKAQEKNNVEQISTSSLTITDETIKKDSEGNVISNEKFNEYLNSGEYLATPIIENGKIVEAQLQKASKEQIAQLKEMLLNSENENGKKAPDFEVTDLQGKTYKLSELNDKTVVLNFWFTTCKPCMIEIPELNELVKENKDVIFLGLATDKEDNVKSFLKKHPFEYHIIANSRDIVKLYDVSSFPTHYIIKNGIIQNKFIGLSSDIKEKIQNSIDGKQQKNASNVEVKNNEPIMLNSNSDIRNEKGEKLDMMEAVEKINSQKYTMESATDENGNEYILIRKL